MINPLKSKAAVMALVVIAVALPAARFAKAPGGTAVVAQARPRLAPVVEEVFQVRPRVTLPNEEFLASTSSGSPLRDPFAWPLGSKGSHEAPATGPTPLFVLQAISIEGNTASAVLNRRAVGVGDKLDQFTVERILPTEVWLRGAGGQFVVRLAR